jgi:aryl-alcohol dehydrogenase-like predicted oxidoreductase
MKANKDKITRRTFLRKTSSIAAGALAAKGCSSAGVPQPAQESKILNYNSNMGYRRLGKTGIMISEISLGGHGGFYKEGGIENRRAVLDRAAELGLNYVDNNIADECDLYGKAMDGTRRENWYIGFASWPQKVTEEYEKELSKEGMIKSIEDRLRGYRTDYLDIWRPVGATWGEGQKNMATMLMVSHRALDMVVEVFEKVRKQGKVRWLAISAHNPKVFRRVLNEYPQFSLIIFPYLFLTRELGGDSLLALAKEKDVGVIGLKPFGAGTTFNIRPSEISGRVDKKAASLLKNMLTEPRISAVIPGVNTPEQLEVNVKGSYERGKPVTSADRDAVRQCTENYYANLTPEYQWLRNWERV